ncbi:MAG: sulfotransferase domain-containing protein [Phycisphaerales bacterium]|nr:sulfotransferase domain-containing protein [Phycisphaerales bacterium]
MFEGVPARAMRVLGPETRLLYVVRDPIKRIVSQHRHEVAVGKLETRADINDAVREIDRYLAYSRYAWQVEPWIETFGPERVRVIVLERYVRDRVRTVTEASRFLGLEPVLEGLDEGKVFNKGDDRRVVRGPWRRVLHGSLYKRFVRPLMSGETRQRLRRVFLPRAAPIQTALTAETEAWLRGQLAPDTARFVGMLGEGDLLLPRGDGPFLGWEASGAR